jgi:hypothetical protein
LPRSTRRNYFHADQTHRLLIALGIIFFAALLVGFFGAAIHGVDARSIDYLVREGVKLLIDPTSFQYLVGAEIDYQEDLEGAQFVIRNPNATTTCGCGSSFSA